MSDGNSISRGRLPYICGRSHERKVIRLSEEIDDAWMLIFPSWIIGSRLRQILGCR